MAAKISVVIPTKNGGELFRELLKKLFSQKASFEYEVLIVDSGSTDDTLEHARNYGARTLSIEPNDFNHGATRNLGISKTTSDFVVLMTQDAIPANECLLEEIIKPFLLDNNIAGVYARQSPRPDADVLTKRNLNEWLTARTKGQQRRITDRKAYDMLQPIDRYKFCNFDNVCSAIRRSAWTKIPFSTISFGEDIEWSKRALESGWTIAYTPAAHVVHSHDRPISYEYKRTYMCHQTLYRLFEVRTVPSWRHAVKSILHTLCTDFKYVIDQNIDFQEKISMLLKIPALSVASVWGQYRGAREEYLHRGRTMAGI